MRLSLAFIAALALAVTNLLPVAAAPDAGLKALGKGGERIQLQDVDGRKVHLKDFNGAPRVLFFGFTNCPVVCPVTVWELDAALESLGAPAKDVRIIFVTLDPARDTPAVMKKYFSGFKGRVIALSAPLPQVTRLARAYDVRFERVDTGKGGYSIDHTAQAFLVNAEGTVVDTIAFGASRELSTSRLKALIQDEKRQN